MKKFTVWLEGTEELQSAELTDVVHMTDEEKLAFFDRFWMGGLSNEKRITEADVDPEQLRMGIEVEYEHTPDRIVAKKIALDHLAEFPTYYTGLDKMEKELEAEASK